MIDTSRYVDSIRRVVPAATGDTQLCASRPDRVSLLIANDIDGSGNVTVRCYGSAGDYLSIVIAAGSYLHIEWQKQGLLVQRAWSVVGTGLVESVGVYELMYEG